MPSIIFNNTFKHWTDDPEENLRYLKTIERECNDILMDKGYLFLSQVFDMMEHDSPYNEFTYGWWIDDSSFELPWDVEDYVSFGLYSHSNARNREFINGLSPIAWLDFNTTGDIAQYLLDRAIKRSGIELTQDYFDYPELYMREIEWSDYIY